MYNYLHKEENTFSFIPYKLIYNIFYKYTFLEPYKFSN